jgi:hypothetical protein
MTRPPATIARPSASERSLDSTCGKNRPVGASLPCADGQPEAGTEYRACKTGTSSEWPATCFALGMNNIIYVVGLVVVIIAVLSFFGFR